MNPSSVNHVLLKSVSKQVLRHTSNYLATQYVECLIIVACAFLEVALVTRLLKREPII